MASATLVPICTLFVPVGEVERTSLAGRLVEFRRLVHRTGPFAWEGS
jgi:hypothetical protein